MASHGTVCARFVLVVQENVAANTTNDDVFFTPDGVAQESRFWIIESTCKMFDCLTILFFFKFILSSSASLSTSTLIGG